MAVSIRNDATTAVAYDLSHVSGVAAGPNTMSGASYNLSGVFDAPATVSFDVPSILVPAKGSATLQRHDHVRNCGPAQPQPVRRLCRC